MSAARGLQDLFDRADELASAGRYFDAHEELEAAWKAASGDEKLALQGVIQLAAGLHRLRLRPDKPDGAYYLFARGLDKLSRARGLIEPDSFDALALKIAALRRDGRAPDSFRFGLRALGLSS